MHYLLSIIFTIFILQGCTTKQNIKMATNKQLINTHESNSSDDDFENEFKDNEPKPTIDPLKSYNQIMTQFNDTVFTYALNPLSEGYAYILSSQIRKSISNAIHNLQFPIRFTNNLLQGKFQNSTDEVERFIINSTLGIGGLFDPANTYMHIPAHNEDFGQTLGYYGVGAGFHIVLPFLGPSNVRDLLGLTMDAYTSPLLYQKGLIKYKIPQNDLEAAGIYGLETVNKNSLHLGAYKIFTNDAMELYPFLKDAYEQKRLNDINE